MLFWYYKLLALHSKWIAFIVVFLTFICTFSSVYFKKLPDFSDPALGFEARGTEIANRLTSWKNLQEETRPSGLLTSNPSDAVYRESFLKYKRLNKQKIAARKKKLDSSKAAENINLTSNALNMIETGPIKDTINGTISENKKPKREAGNDAGDKRANAKGKRRKKAKYVPPPVDNYFCDAPSREYAHIVLAANNNASFFDFDAINVTCQLEIKLTNLSGYDQLCQVKMISKTCCRPWSIPNYVALLSNKSSCANIEEADIPPVKQLLTECYEFYRNGSLRSECESVKCNAPLQCTQYNAAYHILHFLADNRVNATNILTSASMIYLPIAQSTKILPYYYEMDKMRFQLNDNISIVAINMDLKNALFDELLIYDGWLIGLGAMFILYCTLIYTNSIIITVSTVFANFAAISIAYFVYQFVFQLSYFPFMNLLAIIIIVGIGADDCFVFVKEWKLARNEWHTKKDRSSFKCAKKVYLVSTSMKHAAKSIFVTSVTTAFAFYASFFSSITAIRCFSIYAGTVVLVNYVLMISWLPAIVAIDDDCNFSLCFCWKTYLELINKTIDRIGVRVQKLIIYLVDKFKWLFIVLFFTIGLASGYIVFYYPKLALPDSQEFQLFSKDHPFELYDSTYKNLFNFEKSFTETETFNLPLRFVWGVEAQDDGNYLIPSSKGELHAGRNLTLSSPETQLWLLNFCKELRKQDFYRSFDVSTILPNCFIENLIENMNKRCFDPMTNTSRSPCCDDQMFPYKPDVFDKCLPEMISSLYKSPRYIFVPGSSGPKFDRYSIKHNLTKTPIIRALVIEYESSQPFSTSFMEIANFTNHVQNWFNNILTNATTPLQNGWFISELNFYDLQQTLLSGTIIAACIAMISSLIVLLLFTMNFLISIYAVLTVIFSILTTIAILVLFDWKLNILESIAASTAIGLGIDFVFHYALCYRLSDKSDAKSRTIFSLSRMIGPTLMAAFTSWLAGFFMIFSNLLAYIQIGMFLMIVMAVSWLYATFFFASLLSAIGPKINTHKENDQSNHMQDVELIQKSNNITNGGLDELQD